MKITVGGARESTRRRLLAGVLALLAAAAVAAGLLAGGLAARFDTALLAAFDPAAPWRVRMLDLTALGSSTLVTLFAAGGVLLLLVLRRGRDALHLGLAAAGSGLLVQLLKPLYARPRPDLLAPLADYAGSAFPSGHALMATALAGTFAWCCRHDGPPAARALLWGFAALVVLAVAASRIYLRVHWPSDVLGGVVFGALWAALAGALASALAPPR